MPYATSSGVRVYWEDQGRGDPLLLIMGTGCTLDMWYRVRPRLAERYRLIAFDNRGVGRSDVPDGPYTVAQMAADAVAVLDDARVEAAHVVGAWLGGAVAQELALAHPGRVASLVLVCTSAFPHAVDPEPEVFAMLARRASMTPEESVRAAIPFTYEGGTPRERIEEDVAVRLRTHPSVTGYLGQRRATDGYDTRGRLAEIAAPTLVIHGDGDRLVPPGNGEDLAKLIPGARLALVARASHTVFTDQPEETVRLILTFLDEAGRRLGAGPRAD